jgi:hypothetical protein
MMTNSTPSLLDYARDPWALPSPLPPQSDRRMKNGPYESVYYFEWPAALLATPALAHDLAARGVTFRRSAQGREAWLIDGVEADPVEVADVAIGILNEAADLLDGEPGDQHRADAYALRQSARAIRISRPAERNLLRRLRQFVPAPPEEATVDTFLGAYDDVARVRRSDLGTAYMAAGSPGGLSTHALYRVAAERWAPPVRVHGNFCFHPARAIAARRTPPPSPLDDVAATLSALIERHGADVVAGELAALLERRTTAGKEHR